MANVAGEDLRAAGQKALAEPEQQLLGELLAFIAQRLSGAERARESLRDLVRAGAPVERVQAELHGFVRDCWDALDGLGRVVNVCLYGRLPGVDLWEPGAMTRQCTFYTVRRVLRGGPSGGEHPVGRLLWNETRVDVHPAYARLSFVRNLALFAPIPLPEPGVLPGWDDLAPHLASLLKAQGIGRCAVSEGAGEMLAWLRGFIERCCAELAQTLAGY
ncbi:MAG: hypothetical protein QGH74_06945 [Candidatus Brocadiia bacterium]|nr:hypothetical protein [Candidatus Brocadiia bacterium]